MAENITIEEEVVSEGTPEEENWTEEILVAGDKLIDFLKELATDVTVRHVIVKKPDGSTFFEMPVIFSVGALVFPRLFALVTVFGWFADYTVAIERREPAEAEAEAEEEVAPAADPVTPDNLTKIKGIGPKTALLLQQNGIFTYAQLAATSVDELQAILDKAGARYRVIDPTNWPASAAEFGG